MKPTANIYLVVKRLNAFPPRSGTIQQSPRISGQCEKARKGNTGQQTGKEEIKPVSYLIEKLTQNGSWTVM